MNRPCHHCLRTDQPTALIEVDPYDFVSGSPILMDTYKCLSCYSQRVNAAFAYLTGRRLPYKGPIVPVTPGDQP